MVSESTTHEIPICYNMSMQLIIGLGNPGNEYNFTRHNFGFLALDFYATIHNLTWQKPKFNSIWLKDADRIFIKPQTFYNDSGIAVSKFLNFYKLTPQDIFVICDDFNLPFSNLRFRAKGSSGGNNGLKSISEHLHTTDFPRLRLGTGNDELRQKLGDTKFVLGRFTETEKAQLPQLLRQICTEIDQTR